MKIVQYENPLGSNALSLIFQPSKRNPSLIKTREGVTIEYKQIFEEKKLWKYGKTIASFANHLGGYLIFGVKDKPHEMIGMSKDSLKGFNQLDPKNLRDMLVKYFEPEIRCEMYVHEFEGKSFGIIYTYASSVKPVLCRASKTNENNDGTVIDEGDIYYRYSGSSTKIRYPELFSIIQEERNEVHQQWMQMLGKITSAGLDKISVLDLNTKALISDGSPVYIDEDLASQLAFVKEGHFVDNGGRPTLVLKGSVETVAGVKAIAMPEKVPTTINDTDIIETFLLQKSVTEPELYISQICYQSSGNLPVFYFMSLAHMSRQGAIELINNIERTTNAKKILMKRLRDKKTSKGSLGKSTNDSGKKKQYYHDRICRGQASAPSDPEELKYFLGAICGMEAVDIHLQKRVIFEALYSVLKEYLYKEGYKTITQSFRSACCWVDEALFAPKE